MEMRNFDVEFTTRHIWPYIRPDALNNTSLYLNNELVWPLDLEDGEQPPVLPATSVEFRLEIPSGTLEGIIRDVVDVNGILETWTITVAVWTGKYAGLTGGKCGIGWFSFSALPETTVQTSIAEDVLTYGEYIAIRRMVEAACGLKGGEPEIWLGPAENQELMRSAWRCLQKLRKEAERLEAE